MNTDEARGFMKDFFERLYGKLADTAPILLKLPDLPEEMLDGAEDDEGWGVWKLIPSTVTDADIAAEEKSVGLKFPNILKAFIGTYHHGFEPPVGRNFPDEPFETLDNAFNPHLAANGYLPFSWDAGGYYILCIDLNANEDGDRCPVVQFGHEELFDMMYDCEDKGEEIPKKRLEELAENVADSFVDFLNAVYDGSVACG